MNVAKDIPWFVRLGRVEWERHTYERPASDALRLLGSVRRGQQIGALATNHDGDYFQVVGDYVVPLKKSKIEAAVAKATAQGALATPMAFNRRAAAPVVTVKRRRIPLMT